MQIPPAEGWDLQGTGLKAPVIHAGDEKPYRLGRDEGGAKEHLDTQWA